MEFYADSANINRIKELLQWVPLTGVTTNPTLVAGENVEIKPLIDQLLGVFDGFIQVQALPRSKELIIEEAKRISAIDPDRIIVKIPVTLDGLQAIRRLRKLDIKCMATAVFTQLQAIIAAEYGALYVAPYLSRVDRIGQSGIAFVEELQNAMTNNGFQTKVIAASIKDSNTLRQIMNMAVDAVTLHPDVYLEAIHHPLTDTAVHQFESDWLRIFQELTIETKPILREG